MEVDDSREFCLGAVRGCQPNGDIFEDIGIRALAFNIGFVKTRCVDKPYTQTSIVPGICFDFRSAQLIRHR